MLEKFTIGYLLFTMLFWGGTEYWLSHQPNSVMGYGWTTKQALENAREKAKDVCKNGIYGYVTNGYSAFIVCETK